MQKFRKRQVAVEAVQITDSTFDAPHPNDEHIIGVTYNPRTRRAIINTRGGRIGAELGDWIVKGADGELAVCRGDDFTDTYEPA